MAKRTDGRSLAASAGGARAVSGVMFQAEVFAWWAARAVARLPVGLGLRPEVTIVAVGCETGFPVDDVGIALSDGGLILVQAKAAMRRLVVGAEDLTDAVDQVVAAMTRGIETADGLRAVDSARDRIVIATNHDGSKSFDELASVCQRFRNHPAVLALDATATNDRQRRALSTFITMVRGRWTALTGSAPSTESLLTLLRVVEINRLDFQKDIGADRIRATVMLQDSAIATPFDDLVGAGLECARTRTWRDREALTAAIGIQGTRDTRTAPARRSDGSEPLDDGEFDRAVLRKWATERLARLREPPRHMRSLGVGLATLEQDIHLLDPRELERSRSGDGLQWAAILNPADDHFRARAVIVAGPGYGKSTMLATAAARAYEQLLLGLDESALDVLPVHVTCSAVDTAMGEHEPTATTFCASVAAAAAASASSNDRSGLTQFIQNQLLGPLPLIFLDGVDEISEPDPDVLRRRNRFLTGLAAFVAESQARIYLTTRPYDIPDLGTVPFEWLGLRGFSTTQVLDYARRALGDGAGAIFAASLTGRLGDLARIPVLLSFMCLVAAAPGGSAGRIPTLPNRMYDLYSAVTDRIVGAAWRESSSAARRRERLLQALPEIAFRLLGTAWRADFSALELSKEAGQRIAHDLRDAGIIVPVGSALQFLHPSLGEHLVAVHLAALTHAAADAHISAHAPEPAWDNVWPQLAGAIVALPDRCRALVEELLQNGRVEAAAACIIEVGDVGRDLALDVIRELFDGLVDEEARQRYSELIETLLEEDAQSGILEIADIVSPVDAVPDPSTSPMGLDDSRDYASADADAPDTAAVELPVPTVLAPIIAKYKLKHQGQTGAAIVVAYERAVEDTSQGPTMTTARSLEHLVAMTAVLADLGLDEHTLSAALLFNLTTGPADGADVQEIFGGEVTSLLNSLAGLESAIRVPSDAQQAATVRKMLVAEAKDVRVLLIRLADRLQELRTAAAQPAEVQERKAQEAIDIYAPLAERLGLSSLQAEMEDLGFAILYPKRYAEIEHMVNTRMPEREAYMVQVVQMLESQLADLGIDMTITSRSKNAWSIYEKMVVKRREFDEIYDLVGIRVVVRRVRNCYSVLHLLHSIWKPIQGRFFDYIAMPRSNYYQALETTVVGPQGKPLEVQIRTQRMDTLDTYGVATKWQGGDDHFPSPRLDDPRTEEREAEAPLDSTAGSPATAALGPTEWLAGVGSATAGKVDLEEEIVAFTPWGAPVNLSPGATPFDFATAINRDFGPRCVGARVAGRLVPLTFRLPPSSFVEVYLARDVAPA